VALHNAVTESVAYLRHVVEPLVDGVRFVGLGQGVGSRGEGGGLCRASQLTSVAIAGRTPSASWRKSAMTHVLYSEFENQFAKDRELS
jgi:hypothetical protein